MTQEYKELLKDLCGRLPYGVKCIVKSDGYIGVISSIESQYGIAGFDNGRQEEICDIKPYLYPLSSMTSKQKADLSMLVVDVEDIFKSFLIEVEFYHKHHIDYRGLIPMGLAIDATGLNIYKEETK